MNQFLTHIRLRAVMMVLCLGASASLFAQGYFSGDVEMNTNFFVRDSTIGAIDLPHYDNYKSGTDAWFSLNYNNNELDLTAGARLDIFNNSILHEPSLPYTGIGFGKIYISKGWHNVKVTAGNFYDQFGSGLIFRSYEERPLGIDNSILGLHVKYNPHQNVQIKAFSGLMKDRFELYAPIIKGGDLEYQWNISDKLNLLPGVSVINRTLDEASMSNIVTAVEGYDPQGRFVPNYNMYATSIRNTLNYKNWSWYIEGAFKSKEATADALDSLQNIGGNVVYSSLSYSRKGFGITGQIKRTEHFTMRTSPNEKLFDGLLNFIPPISRQNSLRLPARYFAPSLDIEELAMAIDMTVKLSKKVTMNATVSEISNLFMQSDSRDIFFREVYVDAEIKQSKKIKWLTGIHYAKYNSLLYIQKGSTNVDAISPFVEMTYKINRKKSIRTELQYQNVPEDYGQWLYGLIEYNVAPKFSISLSDMWNFDPNPALHSDHKTHYYSLFGSYTHKAHRFTASYVRQVEGIVCTGGICRFEPAFSGFKLGLLSSF